MEDVCQGRSNVQPIMKWLIFQLLLDQRWLTDFLFPSFPLLSEGRIFKLTPVILLEFADVTCKPGDRKKFCILVTGHDHPRYFYKERLEIVAKAVAGLKDGSYEIISVGAAN